MRFTLSWLREHLETKASLESITEKLTALGLEVEEIVDWSARLAGFCVGSVVECKPHPNADQLNVCLVDNGKEIVQVVCGASNARQGIKGVFAPLGSVIPGTGMRLKRAKIRGIESNGMLCSERELNLSEKHEAVIELSDDSITGSAVSKIIGLDDPVIEIAITPNRQDCLGVSGIARDLAAGKIGTLKKQKKCSVSFVFESSKSVSISLVKDSKACPFFVGRSFRGITNGPSPGWLQKRLQAIGLRPISKLVDITNFLTFDRGRPLHVFDADLIEGDVQIRFSKKGETLLALDEKIYELDDNTTVIADDNKVLALGGIIGGKDSGCTLKTENVFLEAALFDPIRTAVSGRRYGIESDARYRFERGVDSNAVFDGVEAATNMILDLCGGESSKLVIAGQEPAWSKTISFQFAKVRQLTGIDITETEGIEILETLGFSVEKNEELFSVSVPSWRMDIDGEADLIEEILRIYGYDQIPVESLREDRSNAQPTLTTSMIHRNSVRRTLALRGLNECVTWSFMPKHYAELFGGGSKNLTIVNPISSDLGVMRPSILPNLIEAAGRNMARGFSNIGLFEVGPQYFSDELDGQALAAACIRSGFSGPRHWQNRFQEVDIYDVKADILTSLDEVGVLESKLTIKNYAPSWYHPGKSGSVFFGDKQTLAIFGELHPQILKKMKIEGTLVGAEIFLDELLRLQMKENFNRGPLVLSDLPAVFRDFNFVVSSRIPVQEVISAVQSAGKDLIEEVLVFDIFSEESVGKDRKSIAISIRLQPRKTTLTESDIETVSQSIVDAVYTATGAELRR